MSLLKNCHTCKFCLSSAECRIVLLEDREEVDRWLFEFDLDELELPPLDADGCPGYEQK